MPKDATKNVDRYKIRGGELNEFEYAENQKAVAGKKPQGAAKLIPGTPPEEAGDGLRPTVKAGARKTSKARSAKPNATRGASPKKLAARKAAKKK